jgi:hypothetical protein
VMLTSENKEASKVRSQSNLFFRSSTRTENYCSIVQSLKWIYHSDGGTETGPRTADRKLNFPKICYVFYARSGRLLVSCILYSGEM